MKAVVVYNPRSGSAIPITELAEACHEHGIEIVRSVDVTADPQSELQPYLTQSEVVIIGYGGDGTLNTVASLLRDTKAIFAPIPGGTLNHFTKDLGIPQDLHDALENTVSSNVHRIDVGIVNDRVFLNNSSIGLYPSTLRMRDELERGIASKWIAAIISNVRAFVKYRRMTVEVNGESLKTPFVFIGNNDYKIEHRLIGGRSKMNGDMLSAYAVLSKNRWGLIMILLKGLLGNARGSRDVMIWKSKYLIIRPKKSSVAVSLDGERVVLQAPLTYSVDHECLNVLA